MRHFIVKLGVFFDYVKDIMIFLVLAIFSVLFFCVIVHNLLKIVQISTVDEYSQKYKNFVETQDGEKINIYTIGNGEKTIVIMPGYGVQSPIVMYETLANKLADNYRVVIVEYPGYGFSIKTDKERSNLNIASDVKQALEAAEIFGPYILMPHSISNLYAMKFTEVYPESVQAIISLDGLYPEMIENEKGSEYIDNMVKTVQFSSVLEWGGIPRILSYVKPDMYQIDLLKEDKSITDEDIGLYRKMIATKYLTKPMMNEIKSLEANMKELKDYTYPQNLPVLAILSKDTVKEYDEKFSKNYLENLADGVVSNDAIQKNVIIKGNHMLNVSNPNDVVAYVNQFLN